MNGSDGDLHDPVSVSESSAARTASHDQRTQPGESFMGRGSTPRFTISSTVDSDMSSACASVARDMKAGSKVLGVTGSDGVAGLLVGSIPLRRTGALTAHRPAVVAASNAKRRQR